MKYINNFFALTLFFAVCLISCNASDDQLKKKYDEGFQEAKNQYYWPRYNLGISDGKTAGYGEGKAEGILQGKEEGRAEGIIEGKKKGYRDGYNAGSVAFAKDSWVPTLGVVIVIVVGAVLLGLLYILFGTYYKHILTSYKLRLNKENLADNIVRRKSNQFNVKDGFHEITIEGLEKVRKSLNETRLSLLQDELSNANARGHTESANKVIKHKDSLLRADALIKSVSDEILMDHIVTREKLIFNIIKGIMRDRSIPSETKNFILENLK